MMAIKVPGFFALDLLDNRFPALHGMRVIAILSVIAYHVTWIFMAEQGIFLDPGFFTQSLAIFFGMDLFFLLSGFLIGSILLRSIATTGAQHIKRFYLRRIFRTFPSYYLVLTVLVLASGCARAPGGKPIEFIEDDYPRALAEARARAVPLFVDAWAPWCHTCLS